MTLLNDLQSEVGQIFRGAWVTRAGTVVPESENLKLGNDAVEIEGTVLYADLTDSTALVDRYQPLFAAEIYKTYLHCAAKIIRAEGGSITAYDGDRIMAVYIGDSKNSSAVKTALKINYAVTYIINPALKKQYPNSPYQVQQTVGIDTSKLTVARTGIRGSNDLVWVGRAANYAAKLAALSSAYPSNITADVYNNMNESVKVSDDGRNMWTTSFWNEMNFMAIYKSTWWWSL
jgi:class 3 adenylate cyclase